MSETRECEECGCNNAEYRWFWHAYLCAACTERALHPRKLASIAWLDDASALRTRLFEALVERAEALGVSWRRSRRGTGRTMNRRQIAAEIIERYGEHDAARIASIILGATTGCEVCGERISTVYCHKHHPWHGPPHEIRLLPRETTP